MDVMIIAGRRGEALVAGRVVARIGLWDARSFPDGGWGRLLRVRMVRWPADPRAFDLLRGPGIEVSLSLKDYNESTHEGNAVATPDGEVKMLGDVALLGLSLKGSGPIRRA